MLNRLGYWLRETFASLRRNLTLTMAAVLTAAVSLLLLGVALLARQGVGNQLVQWKGGVQFIVFMKADATEDQIQSVRTALAESPQVDDAKTIYLDKPAAFQEFQRIFRDQKTIAESLTVNDIPPNFKVVPRTDDSDIIQAVGNQLLTKPGVIEVRFARGLRRPITGVVAHGGSGLDRHVRGAAVHGRGPDLEHDPNGHVRPKT